MRAGLGVLQSGSLLFLLIAKMTSVLFFDFDVFGVLLCPTMVP